MDRGVDDAVQRLLKTLRSAGRSHPPQPKRGGGRPGDPSKLSGGKDKGQGSDGERRPASDPAKGGKIKGIALKRKIKKARPSSVRAQSLESARARPRRKDDDGMGSQVREPSSTPRIDAVEEAIRETWHAVFERTQRGLKDEFEPKVEVIRARIASVRGKTTDPELARANVSEIASILDTYRRLCMDVRFVLSSVDEGYTPVQDCLKLHRAQAMQRYASPSPSRETPADCAAGTIATYRSEEHEARRNIKRTLDARVASQDGDFATLSDIVGLYERVAARVARRSTARKRRADRQPELASEGSPGRAVAPDDATRDPDDGSVQKRRRRAHDRSYGSPPYTSAASAPDGFGAESHEARSSIVAEYCDLKTRIARADISSIVSRRLSGEDAEALSDEVCTVFDIHLGGRSLAAYFHDGLETFETTELMFIGEACSTGPSYASAFGLTGRTFVPPAPLVPAEVLEGLAFGNENDGGFSDDDGGFSDDDGDEDDVASFEDDGFETADEFEDDDEGADPPPRSRASSMAVDERPAGSSGGTRVYRLKSEYLKVLRDLRYVLGYLSDAGLREVGQSRVLELNETISAVEHNTSLPDAAVWLDRISEASGLRCDMAFLCKLRKHCTWFAANERPIEQGSDAYPILGADRSTGIGLIPVVGGIVYPLFFFDDDVDSVVANVRRYGRAAIEDRLGRSIDDLRDARIVDDVIGSLDGDTQNKSVDFCINLVLLRFLQNSSRFYECPWSEADSTLCRVALCCSAFFETPERLMAVLRAYEVASNLERIYGDAAFDTEIEYNAQRGAFSLYSVLCHAAGAEVIMQRLVHDDMAYPKHEHDPMSIGTGTKRRVAVILNLFRIFAHEARLHEDALGDGAGGALRHDIPEILLYAQSAINRLSESMEGLPDGANLVYNKVFPVEDCEGRRKFAGLVERLNACANAESVTRECAPIPALKFGRLEYSRAAVVDLGIQTALRYASDGNEFELFVQSLQEFMTIKSTVEAAVKPGDRVDLRGLLQSATSSDDLTNSRTVRASLVEKEREWTNVLKMQLLGARAAELAVVIDGFTDDALSKIKDTVRKEVLSVAQRRAELFVSDRDYEDFMAAHFAGAAHGGALDDDAAPESQCAAFLAVRAGAYAEAKRQQARKVSEYNSLVQGYVSRIYGAPSSLALQALTSEGAPSAQLEGDPRVVGALAEKRKQLELQEKLPAAEASSGEAGTPPPASHSGDDAGEAGRLKECVATIDGCTSEQCLVSESERCMRAAPAEHKEKIIDAARTKEALLKAAAPASAAAASDHSAAEKALDAVRRLEADLEAAQGAADRVDSDLERSGPDLRALLDEISGAKNALIGTARTYYRLKAEIGTIGPAALQVDTRLMVEKSLDGAYGRHARLMEHIDRLEDKWRRACLRSHEASAPSGHVALFGDGPPEHVRDGEEWVAHGELTANGTFGPFVASYREGSLVLTPDDGVAAFSRPIPSRPHATNESLRAQLRREQQISNRQSDKVALLEQQIQGLLDKTRSRSLARALLRPLMDPLTLSGILSQINKLKDPSDNPTASMVTLTVIRLQLIAFHKSVMLYKPYSGTVRTILCNPEERFGQLFCLSHDAFRRAIAKFDSPDALMKLKLIVREMLNRFLAHFDSIHNDVKAYVRKRSVGSYAHFNEEYADAIREVKSILRISTADSFALG